MSKFLHLGMKLEDVIGAASTRAADAMNQPQLGRLQAGLPADVSILKLVEGRHILLDSGGEERIASQRLVPVHTFKNGARFDCNVAYDNKR